MLPSGCMVSRLGKKADGGTKTAALINLMRRAPSISRSFLPDPPTAVRGPAGSGARLIDGYVFLSEGDNRPFIDKNLISGLKQVCRDPEDPFFGALRRYAEEGTSGGLGPGHNGACLQQKPDTAVCSWKH